jgi:outer membrane protein assembly factor BamB
MIKLHRSLRTRRFGIGVGAVGAWLLAVPALLLPTASIAQSTAQTVDPGSALVARSTTTRRADWPQFQRGPGRQGENPYEKILKPSNVARMTVRWNRLFGSAEFQAEVQLSPVVADGIVYAYSKGRPGEPSDVLSLWALDAATGAERWSKPNTADFFTHPLVVARGLLVAQQESAYVAFDAKTGDLRWRSYLDGKAAPAIVWESLYVAGPYVQCADLLTGKRRDLIVSSCPRAEGCGGYWGAPPAVTKDMVYMAEGGLRANERATGRLVFDLSLGRYYNEVGPLVEGETVYVKVANEDSTAADMYAVDAHSGAVRWRAPVGKLTLTSPAALSKGALFVGFEGGLVALNAATGARLWTQRAIGAVTSAPAVANGVVYCLTLEGWLYALDAKTCRAVQQQGGRLSQRDIAGRRRWFGVREHGRKTVRLWAAHSGPRRSG